MANADLTATTGIYQRTARKAGITIPDAIVTALDPAQHPRAQLEAHLTGTPTTEEAIAQALTAGRNPATDKGVITALNAQRVRERTGNLDAVHDQRIRAAFREHWTDIVDAVHAVFDPAADAFTRAHQILKAKRLHHEDTDAIRRTGGDALAAWSQSLAAQDVLASVPTILTNAAISAGYESFGNVGRVYWTILPNLDTWIDGEPSTKDLWSVLDTGATLNLASTLTEAQQRAQLANRERELAHEARRAAGNRAGFNGTREQVTYTGADGITRIVDAYGSSKPYHGYVKPYAVSLDDDGE